MEESIYIDENINILTGDEAERALTKDNDKLFLSKDSGIINVTLDRWKKAQHTEKKHWMVRGIKNCDDRNYFHKKNFNNYKAISGFYFKNAIELGCGPFTNLRLIAPYCIINKCTLLDPLINEYLNHPYCAYTNSFLWQESIYARNSLISKIIRRLSYNLDSFLFKKINKKVPVTKLLPLAIEKIEDFDPKFDLVVIINVIEHCYDINLILKNISKLLSTDGILVFSDKIYSHLKVTTDSIVQYDAAHPLKVDIKIIKDFLTDNFDCLYTNNKDETIIINSNKIISDHIYFIGRKKRS